MSFRKKRYLTLIILSSVCFGLAIATTLQGPRISQQTFDSQPAQQRLILSFSTPLQSDSIQTDIKPQLPHTVSSEGRTLYINFPEPLPYGTEYNVNITVTDTRNRTAQVQANFETAPDTISYLFRSDTAEDELRRATLTGGDDSVLFTHEKILAHAASNQSYIVAVDENNQVVLKHLQGSRLRNVDFPEKYSLRSFEGSPTKDTYLFTLTDESLSHSGWEYNPATNTWRQLIANVGNSLLGSIVSYAPDGQSLYYFDQNRNLLIDDPDDNRAPSVLGVYDMVARIAPNHSAILAGKGNGFQTISPSGESLATPDQIQLSFQPKNMQNTKDFVYITQGLDSSGTTLLQFLKLVSLANEPKIIAQEAANEQLFLQLSISPNDQYIVLEQAFQPVIYDSAIFNKQPNGVFSVIRDSKSGNTIRTLEGFDVIWR